MHWFLIIVFSVFSGYALAETPRNPSLASDWAMGHGTSAQTAFTKRPGPTGTGRATLAQHRKGVKGISPWLVETGRGKIYGASLTHLFRYRTAPNVAFEDGFQLTRIGSISWNLITIANRGGPDLVIVPQPLGLRPLQHRNSACAGRDPALLVFEDRDGPLTCSRQITFRENDVARLCNAKGRMGYTAAGVTALWDGTLVITSIFRNRGERFSYLINIDPRSGRFLSCISLGKGRTTNNFPVEPLGNGKSAMYIASDFALLRIDQQNGQLTQRWYVSLNLAERTGTTPTLIGDHSNGIVALVEGICAVTNVFTGRIDCSNRKASRLLWVKRSGNKPATGEVALPPFIRTVENSPATNGRQLVIADYGGYSANREAGGVVSMIWDGKGFKTGWSAPDVHFNGVVTISGGSGLAYSSGLDASGRIVVQGLRLDGETRGQAAFTASVGDPTRFLDAGGNIVVLPGKRMVYSVNEGLVVVE